METELKITNQNQSIPEPGDPKNKKQKDKEIKKFSWWQTSLLIFLTLIISVGTAYYVSDKYFWSNMDMGRVNEQLKHYKGQVDSEPNEPKHRVNLGYTYFLKEDYDNAIKQLKVAIDLDKNYYDAYLNLSLVYREQDRLNDALKMAQKAVDISPKDYKGLLQKGIVYRELKMYEDALSSLNKANKAMPGNTDIIYEIGKVAEEQGAKDDAEKIYKEALAYDPLYKPALEGLDRISEDAK